MPNIINAAGLQVKTQAELVAQWTARILAIYPGANLEQNTPDGQLMMNFIQEVLDLEDLLVQIYNMFDPDNAIGVVLDQRVAINGIQRQGGTYTVTDEEVVTDRALNLYGLDQTVEPVYTVSDSEGNNWFLIETQNISAAGVHTFQFRAELPGANLTTPNTINIPVTIVLGVVSVNNPNTYTTLGLNEESDMNLKIRRQRSVSLASQGYLAGLYAALENINGITSVFIYENNTGATDVDGVPSHSIWVIVAGTAPDSEIAQAIYTKRNAGCGMKGDIDYNVTQVDGSIFTVRWDTVITEAVHIEFTATSLDGINPPNIVAIQNGLPLIYKPNVNEQLNANQLATLVQEIDPNTLVTNAGFSLDPMGPFTPVLSPSTKNRQFSVTTPNINITVG